ncbi:MAG TPA: putative peptidoglycan glycosyltransferase FtsW [Tepidisphaeraceae bacterium]|nr:putative peptidoglycan glycosyltransferase FtsW [Tepidisphaeraceae bacterium]
MDPSIYRLRHRDLLALCVISLLCLGVVMVQSAAKNVTGEVAWAWTGQGTKHVVYAVAAVGVFFGIGCSDYRRWFAKHDTWWRSPIVWLGVAAVLTNVLVLVPGIGKDVNGARRWLPLGFTQVQPSEIAKWATVCFLAWWLAHRPVKIEKFWGFLLTLVPVGVIALLVVIQDFGTAALIAVATLCMLMAGRVRSWHLAVVLPPVMAAGFWFVYHKEYRWKRMTAFLDPYASPQGEGYHMIQSLLSFSTGGVLGRGLGNGIQKLGYLPEDTTDFIFAVVCEELGLFGALLTMALYGGIVYVAWQVVRQRGRDPMGRLIAFGVAAMVTLQAVINMAVATVSVPTKGLSLPLVSAGGSGLVITCAALGLLYSVARTGPEEDAAADRPPHRLTPEVWERLQQAA